MASVTCISYFSFAIPQSVLTTQLLNAVNQTQLLQAEKQRATLKPQNDAEFRRSVKCTTTKSSRELPSLISCV